MKKILGLVLVSSLTFVSVALAQQKAPAKAAPKVQPAVEASEQAADEEEAPAARRTRGAQKAWKRPYGMAGCGLGSMVVGRRGAQPLAWTSNMTGFNTFAISSGTSNCVDGPAEHIAMQMDRFILVNKVAVAQDIARGNGETVRHLSAMMGCGEGAQVGAALQQSFGEIYPNETVDTMTVTDSIITVIKNDAALAKQCGKVG